ncbi:hypothetical protein HGO97_014840 [Faecalicatena sp. AGMB00832]|uniref:Uncharacterized protein n=1 Tax=Faecalicatena faecalis TaxID=2726362 RepID=A0ABS6D653_9FIRM|nr:MULTISPECIES: DUF6465 family protein [Faecalicatena]MBU3877085.1 hypothetical protein [Faecalicatena faecalis]MCI6467090.1 DUF6465 family protein [Faecalicatena sp.]MDY5618874.1 DUF6465 family protein [Lachnospiraceae bacterium]
MSKRIDKKRLKRQNENTANTTIAAVSLVQAQPKEHCEQVDFFIQYHDQEYLEKEIVEKIKEKCKADGIEITVDGKLSVYLKPEDKKAYYTYEGVSGHIEL